MKVAQFQGENEKLSPSSIKWSDDLAEELHGPVIHHFERRRVEIGGLDKIWAADLIDMQASCLKTIIV